MHISVLNLIDFIRVTVMRETTETRSVQVHSQGLVASNQDVDSQVKLLATYQKWVIDVLLNDIRLGLRTVRFPAEIVLPLRDLSELIQEEDTTTL